jgi:hypothetical protein
LAPGWKHNPWLYTSSRPSHFPAQTALHLKHLLRSPVSMYGALTPIIHCHILIFQLAGWLGVYYILSSISHLLYSDEEKINILFYSILFYHSHLHYN